MDIRDVAKLFGYDVKENNKAMKNKEKAKSIVEKILKCHVCGSQMKWVEDTNICVCPSCTYTIGKKDNKETFSVSKSLQDKSRRFLENNYHIVVDNVEG